MRFMTGTCNVILSSLAACVALSGTLDAQTAAAVVVYDEAHHNNPSDGPLGELLEIARSLGAEVRIGRRTLDQELQSGPNVLIVAGPMSVPREEFYARFRGVASSTARMPMYWTADLEEPAFSDTEVKAVFHYVAAGGALLLILDHTSAPAFGLTRALGADMRNVFTWDALHFPPGYPVVGRIGRFASSIYFSRESGMIGDHPITTGVAGGGRVESVATYVGSSIQGPIGSTSLLVLSDSAMDYYRPWPDGPEYRLSAAGRSQAVAYQLGRGRIVIVGETSALMKVPVGPDDPRDPGKVGIGLDYTHAHNRRFAHNAIAWLLRLGDQPDPQPIEGIRLPDDGSRE
jgi:hypothetical protein